MADSMVIDVDELKKTKPEMEAKKSLKRKRASLIDSLSIEEKTVRIEALRDELEGLFKYYKEVLDQRPNLDMNECSSSNLLIACLIEESDLSLSKLVDEIYEKLKVREGGNNVTLVSVKSSVLFIGQRSFYGVPNSEADVLEDQTDSCLWCWETRDVKMMPKSVRGVLKIRRTCRRKIHERITAVSATITALQKSECSKNNRQELMKASERLGKVLKEADIRLLVETMVQKNGADMAENEAKREEKLLIKRCEKNKREVEKEKKRMDRELQKEKLQSEKELRRLQEEAEKEERRREKEESEMRKQQKRQQEEVEKEQRRKEKEEAELKRQLALQKQASIMERFLKNGKSSTKATTSDSSPIMKEKIPESVTQSMDRALSLEDGVNTEDIWRSHLISWRHLGQSIHSNRKQHWGLRQKPKTEIIKELKLTDTKGLTRDDESSIDRLVDGCDETNADGRSCHTNADNSPLSNQKYNHHKQLLQFDKSNRPAFYGIWPRKTQVVGPRHPLEKDPELDYDIDSDEEWEEEEPGESLSDCEKDVEEESLEEGFSKADDEDESEDGFFVPDGYLSENEGVEVDRMDSEDVVDEAKSLPSLTPELESEEFRILFRQQKQLNNLTVQALRKNQPLIISNLMHEKSSLLPPEDLTGTSKLEQTCLRALSMFAFPVGPSIEISIDTNVVTEDQEEACPSNSRAGTTPVAIATTILDSDMPQIVSIIQSCPHGINKVVESLQQKFPTISKKQLGNKVREISEFVDNRWQVKKEILNKLGLSISPEKGSGKMKSIKTFFSKRCLPPTEKTINLTETSPLSSQKATTSLQQQQQQGHAYNK